MRLAASPKTRIRIGMAIIAITTRMMRATIARLTCYPFSKVQRPSGLKPDSLILPENGGEDA